MRLTALAALALVCCAAVSAEAAVSFGPISPIKNKVQQLKNKIASNAQTASYTLAPLAMLLSDAALSFLTSYSSGSATVVFSNQATEIAQLQPGNVIVSFQGSGFMRKVVSVSLIGNSYVVMTTSAALTDAFSSLHISSVKTFSPEQVKKMAIPALGVRFKPEAGLSSPYVVPFDVEIGSLSISGEISTPLSIEMNIDLDWGLKQLLFKISADPTVTLNIDVSKSVSGEIPIFSTPKIVLWHAPPITGTVTLLLGGEASIGTSDHLQPNLTAGLMLTGGLEYTQAGGWQPIAELSSPKFSGSLSLPTAVSGSVKAYAGLKMATKIFDVAGPFAQPNIYGQDVVTVPLSLKHVNNVLSWGVEGKVGAEVDIFGLLTANVSMTLFDFNKVISSHTANTAPTLAWTGETNYAGGGLYPLTGIPTTTFAYRVQYADADNDPPADGYPNVHIKKGGVDIAGSPFAMAYVSGDYNAGAIYRYPISSLAPGTDYTYYFVASDTYSVQATGTPLTPISGPSVIGSAPTISSVVPNPASILTGAATTITCTASDPNGYTLIYTWSPGGGAISGTGAQVTWTAPALIGTYTVGVKVTNVHGGSVQSSTNVVVTASGSDQPDWVSIPGGTYMMGAADLSYATPVHQVTVPSFQMARTLVTNRQYRACVTAGACTAAYDYGAQYDGDDQPVVGVNWYQAKAFSAWAGGRLPSEAEWEYAARSGGQNQNYPWGNAAPDCSLAVYNYTLCGHSATATVCSTPAGNTAQGLCDMAGNAWEWVEDTWHSSYSGAPTDGSAWEDAGSGRVFRGGSWYGIAGYLRSADRNYYGGGGPGDRGSYLGFRPAR